MLTDSQFYEWLNWFACQNIVYLSSKVDMRCHLRILKEVCFLLSNQFSSTPHHCSQHSFFFQIMVHEPYSPFSFLDFQFLMLQEVITKNLCSKPFSVIPMSKHSIAFWKLLNKVFTQFHFSLLAFTWWLPSDDLFYLHLLFTILSQAILFLSWFFKTTSWKYLNIEFVPTQFSWSSLFSFSFLVLSFS